MSVEGYTSLSCATIYPGKLYLGNVTVANDITALNKLGIKNIINATGFLRDSYDNSIEQFPDAFPKEIKYLHIHITDSDNFPIRDYFQQCFNFIDEALSKEEAVLVHCQAGISRSATIVIAYLIYHEKITLKTAYLKVYNAKKNISPNKGFWKQLEDFEIKLLNLKESTYTLIDYLADQIYSMLGERHSRDFIKEKLEQTECDVSMTVALLFL